MTLELLLTVHLEVALAVIYHDLVVHRLTCEVLHVRMHGGGRDSMHVWFTDVLGHHGYAELPQVHLLVISSGDEASSIFDEGDRVYRAEMLLILLYYLFSIGIKL